MTKPFPQDSPAPSGFTHRSVLLSQVVAMAPPHAKLVADATLGGGGHAQALLEALPQAELFGCDRDPAAMAHAAQRLAPFGRRVLLKQLPFSQLAHQLLAGSVDYLLADLGVSSPQLDEGERGFSFTRDGPLDMRMDPGSHAPSAAELVNQSGEEELRGWITKLGEERFAYQVAKAIYQEAQRGPITTTGQLASIVYRAVPAKHHVRGRHPATKTFQALRMVVNQELEQLEALLEAAPNLLAPGGRLAIISFHSLEDRMVKETFNRWEKPCTCPIEIPICVCGKKPSGHRITRKPLTADEEELRENPRARSAKLRVFEKNGPPHGPEPLTA